MLDIQTRATWGAVEATHIAYLDLKNIDSLVVHHLGDGIVRVDDPSIEASRRVMAGIQAFHMITRGWSDIAYHYAIDRAGRVFEGRPWERVSAATQGHNRHTLSVVLLSDGVQQHMTDAQEIALEALWAEERDILGAAITLTDHNDWSPSTCPGPNIELDLQAIRDTPKSDPPNIDTETDMNWYVQSKTPDGGMTDLYITDGVWRNNAPPRQVLETIDPDYMDRYFEIPHSELDDIPHATATAKRIYTLHNKFDTPSLAEAIGEKVGSVADQTSQPIDAHSVATIVAEVLSERLAQ
jgi:hypothetical protein